MTGPPQDDVDAPIGARPAGLTRRFAANVGQLMAGRILSAAMQLVAFALLADYLGPAQLGVFTFAVALVTLFRVVPTFGFAPILARDITQSPAREAALVPNVIYLRLVLGVLAYAGLAAVVLVGGFGAENRDAALIAGTALFLLPLDSMTTVLQVRLRQGWVAGGEAIKAAVLLAGTFALVSADASLFAFVWLYVLTNVINVVVVALAALRVTKYSWTVRTQVWRTFAVAAAPLALANLFIALYSRIDLIILAGLQSAEDVGQYGAAYRFTDTLMLLPSLLTASLIPVLASSWSESRELTRRRYHRVLHLLLLFSAPVAVIGGMTAWRVLPDLPGFDQYEGGGVALSILCGAVAFAYLNFVTQGLLISIHLQRRVLRVTAWATVLNVTGSFVVISLWSYVGAAAMTTATEAFAFSWCLWIAHREAGLGWPVERLPRTVAAVALAAAVAVPLYLAPPLIQLAVAALVYAAAAYAFRALSPADLKGLRSTS